MGNISTILYYLGPVAGNASAQEWLENQLHDPGCTCPVCMSTIQEDVP